MQQRLRDAFGKVATLTVGTSAAASNISTVLVVHVTLIQPRNSELLPKINATDSVAPLYCCRQRLSFLVHKLKGLAPELANLVKSPFKSQPDLRTAALLAQEEDDDFVDGRKSSGKKNGGTSAAVSARTRGRPRARNLCFEDMEDEQPRKKNKVGSRCLGTGWPSRLGCCSAYIMQLKQKRC